MEDAKAYSSSTDQVELPNLLRPRRVPDVPEDVDFLMEHLNDPNYDLKRPSSIRSADGKTKKGMSYDPSEIDAESQFDSDRYSTSRAESRNSTAIDFDDESPYPEVRAAVSSVDDPFMPVNTFRMWFLGLIFTILVSGLNQVFSMRFPSVYITGVVAQLVSLPLGKGLEKILPTTRFNTFGYVWSLNPGPFSIKEHVCITVMANVVVGGAYATDVTLAQKVFYGQSLTFGYQILLALGTQVLGFSLGGLLRQFVVWPSSMIWPGALVNSALFNTLHKNYGKRDGGHMSRERFFCIAMACSFVWYWVPGYLFTALSVFNWVCWIAPNNLVVNALFGTSTGLGMSILTFDWSMIAFIGSPLVTPWWSEMNTAIAFVLMFWIIAPIIYFTNAFNTSYFPLSAFVSWDNMGLPYQVENILTDGIFDPVKYAAYSPVFLSTTLVLAYGISFASFPSVFVHTFLWFRKDIMRRFRSSLKDERDVHSRLMQYYPEVPAWWYATVGVIAFAFLCIAIEIFPTGLPIWGAVIGFVLAAILALPLSMLQAITNQQVPTQVMHQLIAGYMFPGRPVANMIFKTTAFIGTNQAVGFAGDLKLGHYMKIPPRIMFSVQVVAAVVSCFVVTLVQDWMFANIEDICTPTQKDGFRCPSSSVFATASIIWGAIGPRRLFSPGAPYSPLLWFFMVGILAPIPFYVLARRYPLSFWRYINIPVFFAGLGAIPPASGINYISWATTGFIFNYLVRRFHFRWWMRYNYILSAALDAGVALALIVIFFCVQYPKGGFELVWWGNTVWQNTADAMGMPLKMVAEGSIIGPATWS
ncbi:OPT oligopeptide transporter [Crucibulum laeve]|uniref:OPT oligopeptide transporter n=1 Tax=Crucibulum laeve TaxID=68775 RepID=A0A5C3M7H8_9AGAR|nr:OPT oligopeptide transporter [Crucibulum laeve]